MSNTDGDGRPTLYAIYDLGRGPVTFDIVNFFAISNVWSVRSGFSGYHMIFVLGDGDGFRHLTPKDKILDRDEKMWRLRHILFQHAAIARRCVGVTFVERREELRRLMRALHPKQIFPPNYTVDQPVQAFMLAQLFSLKPTVAELDVFEPTTASLRKVDEWLANRTAGKPVVAVTLRSSRAEPSRNSQIDEWIAATRVMRERGFDPVIVPDTDLVTAGTETATFPDLPVFSLGAIDLEMRLALYRRAALNFADNGGPVLMNFFMRDGRVLMFLPVEKLPEVVVKGGLSRMAQLLAVAPGGDFPHATPICRFVWRPDRTDAIIDEFERALAYLDAPDQAGRAS